MPHSRLHPLPRFSRFSLTLLLYGLLGASLERVSFAADLTASGSAPAVLFDDTDTAPNPDWTIIADQIGVDVIDSVNLRTPFAIRPGAPSASLLVRNNGNVGLGTFVPDQKLHLTYGSFTGGIRLEQDTSLGNAAQTWDLIGNNLNFFVQDVSAPQFTAPFVVTAGAPHFSLLLSSAGRVGLGTSTPQGNLHIFGAANKDIFNGMGPDLSAGPAFNFGYSGNSFGPGTGFFNVRGTNSGVNPSLRFATANVQRLIVTNAGRVGIGTLAPAQQLDVNGNIRANGSFISGATTLNVPDYVFEPDYQLMPLSELESYVAREKHLPDVPSAREIKEQGVNVSGLQMQLLKKVEELTLYMLKQEQTITEQGKMIQQLTARLATVERTRQK